MIVKVQLPLASSEPEPKAYVYDQTRKHEAFLPLTGDLMTAMRGRPKAFFHATFDPKSKTVTIEKEADWQYW